MFQLKSFDEMCTEDAKHDFIPIATTFNSFIGMKKVKKNEWYQI